MVSFTPRPVYPQGKNSWYPLDRRLGGPQSHSGRGEEEKNYQPHRDIIVINFYVTAKLISPIKMYSKISRASLYIFLLDFQFRVV
jgi:hypothetical protein